MAFRIDSLDVNGEFVGVRVWATDDLSERATGSNCGVLVFTLDEWLAFHALLAGRSDAVGVEFRGFDRVRQELNAIGGPPAPKAGAVYKDILDGKIYRADGEKWEEIGGGANEVSTREAGRAEPVDD